MDWDHGMSFALSRDRFVNAPSQWETTLQCNVVSHWLGAFTKLSLYEVKVYPAFHISPVICNGISYQAPLQSKPAIYQSRKIWYYERNQNKSIQDTTEFKQFMSLKAEKKKKKSWPLLFLFKQMSLRSVIKGHQQCPVLAPCWTMDQLTVPSTHHPSLEANAMATILMRRLLLRQHNSFNHCLANLFQQTQKYIWIFSHFSALRWHR